jgi:hypothetical protein
MRLTSYQEHGSVPGLSTDHWQIPAFYSGVSRLESGTRDSNLRADFFSTLLPGRVGISTRQHCPHQAGAFGFGDRFCHRMRSCYGMGVCGGALLAVGKPEGGEPGRRNWPCC